MKQAFNTPGAQLAGHYQLTAHKLDGSSRVVADWFENLITNSGLNQIGIGPCINYCQVGSGSNAPTVGDTGLQTYVAGTSGQTANQGGASPTSPYYGWYRRTFRFAAGVAAGNLSEVGVGWAANGSLFSRALIKDANGDPTTITVLSDEVLDVSYELRNYAPLVDTAFTIEVGGVPYDVIGRAANANTTSWSSSYIFDYGITQGATLSLYRGELGAITQGPSVTYSAGGVGHTWQPYVPNSLQVDMNFNFSLGSGNAPGGVDLMELSMHGIAAFQFKLDDYIPKDETKIMTLRARLSWGRYTG